MSKFNSVYLRKGPVKLLKTKRQNINISLNNFPAKLSGKEKAPPPPLKNEITKSSWRFPDLSSIIESRSKLLVEISPFVPFVETDN